MSTLSCRFCEHRNPAGAKFCNECGSPLAFKPCPNCEAIADASAEQCHQCGTLFESIGMTEVEVHADAAGDGAMEVESTVGPATVAPLDSAATTHIPESLAERLDGSGMPLPIEDRPAAQPYGSDAFATRTGAADRAGADAAVDRSTRDFRRAGDRAGRGRTALGVASLAIALFLVGAAGYYAYVELAPNLRSGGDVALAGRNTNETTPGAKPANGAPAADTDDSKGTAAASFPEKERVTDARASASGDGAGTAVPSPGGPVAAQGSPVAASPADAAAPGSVQAGAPVAARSRDAAAGRSSPQPSATPATVAAPPSGNDAEPAKGRAEPSGKSRRQTEASALATQRLIARDLGQLSNRSAPTGQPPLDRDAIETQRLIERDLGPYLRRNASGATGGAIPAIN